MPLLAGGYLGDASGNQIQDASSNNIGEGSVHVAVSPSGILYQSYEAEEPPWWQEVWDIINDPIELAAILSLTPILQNITNGVDVLLGRTQTIITTTDGLTDHMEQIRTAGDLTFQDILDAIAAIDTGGGLTTEEHDQLFGLAPIDYEQIAGDVWGYTLSLSDMLGYDDGPMAQTVLTDGVRYLQFLAGYEGLPVPDKPWFRYCAKNLLGTTSWLGYWSNEASTALPTLDLSLVQADDTAWSFLTREYPGYNWTHNGPSDWPTGGNIWLQEQLDTSYWRVTLTDAEVRAAWPHPDVEPPNVDVNLALPPIVDLSLYDIDAGAPINFSEPFVHTGACHGIKVTISTRGQGVKGWAVGDYTVMSGAGAVGFFGADGFPEPYQWIGYDTAIILPTTMSVAAGFVFSSNRSLTGTVTPFSLTPKA